MKISIKNVELSCLGSIFFHKNSRQKEKEHEKENKNVKNVKNKKEENVKEENKNEVNKKEENEKEENKKENEFFYDYLKENSTIESIELVSLDINAESKSSGLCIDKNKFEIYFKINCQKLNEFQSNFNEAKKELNRKMKNNITISEVSMTITFNISDVEFMFYQANFKNIINNEQEIFPKLFIYLKKFNFECIIETGKKDKIKKYIFPLFPFLNISNEIENLKFHDVVIQMELSTNDLISILFKYESKFKIVNNIISPDMVNDNENIVYDPNKALNIDNHDALWLIYSLVSERFMTYYTLINLINYCQNEFEDLVKKDIILFVVFLRKILKARYTLTNKKIKFYNYELFMNYLKKYLEADKCQIEKSKEYKYIATIYENKILKTYYKYILIITPLTCYFKIPFLKKGIYLIDKYKEINSYNLIYIDFKEYKKINIFHDNTDSLEMYNFIYNLFIYNILKDGLYIGILNYEYIGATANDIKYKKCWLVNINKLDIINKKKDLFNIRSEKQHLYLNEVFFSIDHAAYHCDFRSIKKNKLTDSSSENNIINSSSSNSNNFLNLSNLKSLFLINNGNISKTLELIIKKQCNIHSFNCFFGIFNGFIGNFSVKDKDKDNRKNRITIRDNIKIPSNYRKDNIIYILNIFKYKDGWIDNETIKILDLLKFGRNHIKNKQARFIEKLVSNSLDLSIDNIKNEITIDRLKFFLNKYKEDNDKNNKNSYSFADKLMLEVKHAINKYKYKMIVNNEIKIQDSAILGGIFDEYDIMKIINEKEYYVLLFIDNKDNINKCIKGNGIIFKTNKNYYSSFNKIIKIKFFDIDEYEKRHQNNTGLIEKIKQLKNVIIFPKKSVSFLSQLEVQDISQQDFFISWNKDFVDNMRIDNDKNYDKDDEEEEEDIMPDEEKSLSVSNSDLKKLYIYDMKKYSLKKTDVSLKIYKKATKIYYHNLEILPKIRDVQSEIIDYKNLTKTLIKIEKKELNELELFYLEYIPKCTLVIIDIINLLKELMYRNSVNSLVDLLIGNINININSKKYLEEIDYINDKINKVLNKNFEYLIKYFSHLKNQSEKENYFNRINIISVIIYNICYNPEKIKKIIENYRTIIKKIIKGKRKNDKEKMKDDHSKIEIKDYYDIEIENLGIDPYLLYQSDKLINDNKDENLADKKDEDKKNEIKENTEKNVYYNFFEDFQIFINNKNEIQKYYIPELSYYKYLSKLTI